MIFYDMTDNDIARMSRNCGNIFYWIATTKLLQQLSLSYTITIIATTKLQTIEKNHLVTSKIKGFLGLFEKNRKSSSWVLNSGGRSPSTFKTIQRDDLSVFLRKASRKHGFDLNLRLFSLVWWQKFDWNRACGWKYCE